MKSNLFIGGEFAAQKFYNHNSISINSKVEPGHYLEDMH